MGKVTGFLEFKRAERKYAPVAERVKHWREFVQALSEEETKVQAARCMDCGIPYCHTGCPVNNQIPDWNDLVYPFRLEAGGAKPALDQQLPRGDRSRLSGAVRSLVHAQHRRRAGCHQDHRVRHRRSRLRGGLDRARSCRRRRPASASPSSAPVLPVWRRRSSSPAPAMTCTSTKRTPSRVASCATASPTSRWRRGSSTGA